MESDKKRKKRQYQNDKIQRKGKIIKYVSELARRRSSERCMIVWICAIFTECNTICNITR